MHALFLARGVVLLSSTMSVSLSSEAQRPAPSAEAMVRTHVTGVRFSSVSYAFYGLITLVQMGFGLVAPVAGWALIGASIVMNGVFYTLVRTGRTARWGDPGLTRTQMLLGILFMYLGYATVGPAAPALMIIMASHVVYAMFTMAPRDVWRLVAASLTGLAATMLICGHLWPERYRTDVQLVSFLYAALVVPMIALLADKVTGMATRLRSQRAELEQALARLRELATRDELTLTHNRRHMTELLLAQHEQHRRLDAPMAVALIDLDFFKHVNDQHGHAIGDEVLRRFARIAQSHLRAVDQLSRWGGEEFLVLMPHTSRPAALAALDRLQCSLAEANDLMPNGLKLSFSAGVTEIQPDDSIDAAIERADQAMYRAKTSGRARSLTD